MYSKNEIIHIAQWPTVHDLHLLATRHYAFEGKCFVVAASTVLSKKNVIDGFMTLQLKNNPGIELLEKIPLQNDDLIMKGGSCIIAPDSKLIINQEFNVEKTILAEIDIDNIEETYLTHDPDGHYSRPDIFNLTVNTKKMSNIDFKNE
jgi:predicted amidohydrolase